MHMEPDPARHETVQTGINGPHNNFWTRFPMINHFHLEQCLATKQGCRYAYIWVNYNELTTSSLEIIVSKGNHPQMALIQVSELW